MCLLDLLSNSSLSTPEDHAQGKNGLGTKVCLAPSSLAIILALHVMPHANGRKICTVDSEGSMVITGNILTIICNGSIIHVEVATLFLLVVIDLQSYRMGLVS